MAFTLWTSAAKARRLGATHYASMFGVIPGFIIMGPEVTWIPRTDALCCLEDLLTWLWVVTREMRDEEPDFSFRVGRNL